MNNPNAGFKRLNVLVLDGGGVRGLSSLLILQALMVQINQASQSDGAPVDELQAHHVFQLVAGTSTGGLIALMLGKMGMTVDECITQYERLSKEIFEKKHLRGRITRGLAPTRYSGKRLQKCIRDLLCERNLDENLSMEHKTDKVPCAVVCREHCSSSQYSKLKPRAVPICSLPCKDRLVCNVCDAARATSAAPTFFPAMRIGDRLLTDGGMVHNNPSFAIFFHYTADQRKSATRPTPNSTTSAPQFSPHGDLDCSRVRFTNIGTGAKVDEVESRKRKRLEGLIPGLIRMVVFLKKSLTEIAVNTEEKVDIMRLFQYLDSNVIMYERFNANHGVSSIKLDDHNALGKIREKTVQYLDQQETKDLLKKVGSDILDDYLNIRPTHGQNVQPIDLAIDESLQPPAASNLMPASSSLSNVPSSHSDHLESESHVLFQTGGAAPLAEHPARTLLPDGTEHSNHYAHQDSGITIIEVATSLKAVPA